MYIEVFLQAQCLPRLLILAIVLIERIICPALRTGTIDCALQLLSVPSTTCSSWLHCNPSREANRYYTFLKGDLEGIVTSGNLIIHSINASQPDAV